MDLLAISAVSHAARFGKAAFTVCRTGSLSWAAASAGRGGAASSTFESCSPVPLDGLWVRTAGLVEAVGRHRSFGHLSGEPCRAFREGSFHRMPDWFVVLGSRVCRSRRSSFVHFRELLSRPA